MSLVQSPAESSTLSSTTDTISVLASAKIVSKCMLKELMYVITNAIPVCILISTVLVVAKQSFSEILYWPIMILAVTKMFRMDVSTENLPIELLVDAVTCYILSAIRLDLEEDYFVLDGLDGHKFGKLFLYSITCTWALRIQFMFRAGHLCIEAIRNLLFDEKYE